MARKKIETSLDELRAITKSLYDIQDMRMRIAGRLERKADEVSKKDSTNCNTKHRCTYR